MVSEYNEYVCEALSVAGDIVIKSMMGGYLVESELRYPYESSKTLMHVFDSFDDKSLIL